VVRHHCNGLCDNARRERRQYLPDVQKIKMIITVFMEWFAIYLALTLKGLDSQRKAMNKKILVGKEVQAFK
jgi:hypothetical protein